MILSHRYYDFLYICNLFNSHNNYCNNNFSSPSKRFDLIQSLTNILLNVAVLIINILLRRVEFGFQITTEKYEISLSFVS